MGNYVTKKLNPLLEEYTYNYQKERMRLSLFNGSVEIEDLIL